MNTWGHLLRLTTWGESHGKAIGGVLDGFPAGFVLDLEEVQKALDKRSPGRSAYTSPRLETDQLEVLSGLFDGKTTGAPIAFVIYNHNQQSKDYSNLQDIYRPGHADWVYQEKYGIRDHKGGGRASARETAIRVAAGAMAEQWLKTYYGIEIFAYAEQVGQIKSDKGRYPYSIDSLRKHQDDLLQLPDLSLSKRMCQEISIAQEEGDSIGGIIACIASSVPSGWGEPIYNKLNARLAEAMLSINACKAFEIGDGFGVAELRGSINNDQMQLNKEGQVDYLSNHAGGIIGGISTGQDLRMRLAFKPTPSISKAQRTLPKLTMLNISDACPQKHQYISISGRHDPCVIPRAIPVVRAMCALVLMDMSLHQNTSQ